MRKGKTVEYYSRNGADLAIKKILPAVETRQSHTIEYRVNKMVREGHREGNKSPAVLPGSVARRCINIPYATRESGVTRTGT